MSRQKGHGTHRHVRPSLETAIADAWEDAKKKDGDAAKGTYEVKIFIEGDNPIRSYTVTIVPVD